MSIAVVFAVLALTTLNHAPVNAWTLWYVAVGGNNSWSCNSVGTACRTIQGAINKAAAGDSVQVEAGTYSAATNGESFPITANKNVVIFGVGSSTTIVDAAGSGQNVFTAGGNNIGVYISSFTIQGGNRGIEHVGYHPGYIWGDIAYNLITGNVVGIYTCNSQAQINANNITTNSAVGIRNENCAPGNRSPAISRNIFGWNGAGGTTAAIYNDNSNPSIVNNVIGWNNGSGIFNTNSSSPTITNNTISFNYGGSGIANFNSSSPQIMNNIITSNCVYGIHAQNASSPTNTYNDVWLNGWCGPGYGDYYGTSGGTGSISKDPRFVSIFDAHLLCNSPAINAGTNTGAPSVDYENNPRPVSGRVDMGAYEKQTELFCPVYLPLIRK